MSRAHAALYAALVLGVSGGAAAQEPAIALEWSAPEGCLGAAELEAGVEAMLGYDAFAAEGPASLTGSVRRESAREHVVVLELRRDGAEPETRELRARASRCRALDSVVIVAAGLLVDDARQRILDLVRAEEAIARVAETVADTDTVADSDSDSDSDSNSNSNSNSGTGTGTGTGTSADSDLGTASFAIGGHLDLAGVMSVGILPSPAFGVVLGGGVVIDRLRVSAYFVYYPGAESADSPSVLVDAYAGRLSVDFALVREGIFQLSAGIDATAGALRGRGETGLRGDTSVLPYLDVAAVARAELEATELLAGFVTLALSVPLVAPRFFANVDGVERTLHQSGPVGFAASFGLSLRLGS